MEILAYFFCRSNVLMLIIYMPLYLYLLSVNILTIHYTYFYIYTKVYILYISELESGCPIHLPKQNILKCPCIMSAKVFMRCFFLILAYKSVAKVRIEKLKAQEWANSYYFRSPHKSSYMFGEYIGQQDMMFQIHNSYW